MSARILTWHSPLGAASRLRPAQGPALSPVSLLEAVILLGCGAGAAVAVMLLEFKLKMPGHSILRAVLPMALGLALVPRRGAGVVMGVGAVATATAFMFGGVGERGLGALTSLSVIGPCLDLAVWGSRSGRWIYLSLVAAGVVANLSAMAVQYSAKYLALTAAGGGSGGGGGGGKSLFLWLPLAVWTYPLCGAMAGLLSAIVWFRWNSDSRRDSLDSRT